MGKRAVRRLPDETHDELWAHYLRFGAYWGAPENLGGKPFGDWTVVGLEGWGAGGSLWLCRCACGRLRSVRANALKRGVTRSCGCASGVTHGMTGTRPYRIWAGMRGRCEDPKNQAFSGYGGRGIKVCERWQTFEGFWADMAAGYAPHLTLERPDVNGGYEPNNCCWITKPEQMQNLQRTIWIDTPSGRMTLRQAANAFGIKRDTLRARIRYGWPESRLLEGYC